MGGAVSKEGLKEPLLTRGESEIREKRMRVLVGFRDHMDPGSMSATRRFALRVARALDEYEGREGTIVTEEEAKVIAEIRERIDVVLREEEWFNRPAHVTLWREWMKSMKQGGVKPSEEARTTTEASATASTSSSPQSGEIPPHVAWH
jgi:hypothetical protein